MSETVFSIKKIGKNKIIEVQRSHPVGQYLRLTTEKKTHARIDEAWGRVLFEDETYCLIPSARGKDFG